MLVFKSIWRAFAIILIFGAAFLTFENLAMYEQMEVELAARQDPNYEPQTSEYEDLEPYQMHIMLYYMTVTMSSVGYGDIYPNTIIGRWIVIFVIIAFLMFISTLATAMSKINNITSQYTRSHYEKTDSNTTHILILGQAPPDAIRVFLKEVYNSDHGEAEIDVLIMRDVPPCDEMEKILKHPKYETRVLYLQGSPLSTDDLIRCSADEAACAIIMTN